MSKKKNKIPKLRVIEGNKKKDQVKIKRLSENITEISTEIFGLKFGYFTFTDLLNTKKKD